MLRSEKTKERHTFINYICVCLASHLDFGLFPDKLSVYTLGQVFILGQVHQDPPLRVLVQLVDKDESASKSISVGQSSMGKGEDLTQKKFEMKVKDHSLYVVQT